MSLASLPIKDLVLVGLAQCLARAKKAKTMMQWTLPQPALVAFHMRFQYTIYLALCQVFFNSLQFFLQKLKAFPKLCLPK